MNIFRFKRHVTATPPHATKYRQLSVADGQIEGTREAERKENPLSGNNKTKKFPRKKQRYNVNTWFEATMFVVCCFNWG